MLNYDWILVLIDQDFLNAWISSLRDERPSMQQLQCNQIINSASSCRDLAAIVQFPTLEWKDDYENTCICECVNFFQWAQLSLHI